MWWWWRFVVPIHLVGVFFCVDVLKHHAVTGQFFVAERAYKGIVTRVVCDYPIETLPVTPPMIFGYFAEGFVFLCCPLSLLLLLLLFLLLLLLLLFLCLLLIMMMVMITITVCRTQAA